MVFVTISSKEAEQYAYICKRLKSVVNNMCTARKTLEAVANASFDKSFAKCMYMLTSESLQCENEIRAHIDCMVCNDYEDEQHVENKKIMPLNKIGTVEGICDFFENSYMKWYKKLLKNKHFGLSLKNLIQNHLQQFNWSLMQMRLFNDVQTNLN